MRFSPTHFWRQYQRHQKLAMLPFQGIFQDAQELENIREQKYRYHYLFPCTMMTIILVDTLIQFLEHGFNIDLKNPRFFHHIIEAFMPESFLQQSNVVFSALHTLIFGSNLLLLFDKFAHTDFILLATGQGDSVKLRFPYRKEGLRHIEPTLGRQLMGFYGKFQKRTERFSWLIFFEVHNAFIIPTIFHTGYKIYHNNFRAISYVRFILYNCLCPFYFDYLILCCRSGLQFISQNRLINIKQNFILAKIHYTKFVGDLPNYQTEYIRFRFVLGNILDITREVETFNRFYSKFVTLSICCFGISGCSKIHLVFTTQRDNNLQLVQYGIFFFYGCLYLTILFILNSTSSRTIALNVGVFKRLKQLQIRLLSARALSRTQIIKLDLVNEYKLLLQKCSFKLVNSSTINNRLFSFTIFGCLGVFYMKLISADGSLF